MKGDKAYYNSLFFSCYNKRIKIQDVDLTDVVAKEKRRKAFNIDNIVSNIRAMEERVNSRFSLSNSRISFWIAVIAIIISVYTYRASMVSSSVSDENYKRWLDKGYVDIQQNLNIVNRQFEEFGGQVLLKLDSICSSIDTKPTEKNNRARRSEKN